MEIYEYILSPASFALLFALGGVLLLYLDPIGMIISRIRIKSAKKRKGKKKAAEKEHEKKNGGASPISALITALAGTLGVGNISGVALALSLGGAGAMLWMWISSLFAMAVKYAEITLSLVYRRRDGDRWRGGAMYYIRSAFGRAGGAFALIFSFLCIANGFVLGGALQANAVGEAAEGVFSIPRSITALILFFLTLYLLFGGYRKVIRITNFLVPIVSLIYISLSLYIIIHNAYLLPKIISLVFHDALSPLSVGGGIGGFVFSRAMRYGVSRGLVSNEAGCGTAPMAHATAEVKSPAKQGAYGIIEVFVDTVLFCTLSAFVILIAYEGNEPALSSFGIMMTIDSFRSAFGEGVSYLLSFSVFLFAYATIACQAFYIREATEYITKKSYVIYMVLLAYSFYVAAGAVIFPDPLWSAADIISSLMLIFNCTAILCHLGTVKRETKKLFF